MRKRLAVAVFMLWSSTGALAQLRLPQPNQNKWEFSLFAGHSRTGGRDLPSPAQEGEVRVVGLEFDSGFLAGFRITENLGNWAGAELEYSIADQDMSFFNLSTDLPQLGALQQRVHNISYNFLIYGMPRHKKVRLFGSIGAGASYFQIDSRSEGEGLAQGIDLKDRWKLALSVGGGVKIRLGPRWGVRADVRDVITGVPDFGLPSELPSGVGPGIAFRPDGSLHNWRVSGGLMLTWGER